MTQMTKETQTETPADQGLDINALAAHISEKIVLPADLGVMVNDAVEKAIRDKGLDHVARKSFVIEGAEPHPVQTKEFMAKQFVSAAILHGLGARLSDTQQKALSEGTASAGGYLVPDDYRSVLIARLPELSELYPHVRVIPVDTDAGNMPSLSTDVTITWGRAENSDITETDPAFGQVSWSIVNMSALTYLSRELVSDSNPGIISVITELFTDAIAAERDLKIALGTNSSQPEGILSATGISAVSGCSGALTYNKLVALKFALARKYHKGARWVMNEATLGWVHKISDDNGMPILHDALISDDVPRILGLPFSTQSSIDDGAVVIGDLSRYFWFDRQKMEIETTTSGGDTFQKHQVGIKVVERVDGGVALAEAFKKSGAFTTPA